MNNHNYPKIHYPEVYILEGGYCEYYKQMKHRCQPSGYVRMDDPVHAQSRKEDLDQFRKAKFGRTKSYAYGDSLGGGAGVGQTKRHTAPAGGPAVFAAANAARTRRGGLTTLAEAGADGEMTEDEEDIGDSPCPPPGKGMGVPFLVKKAGRAPLLRAETVGRFGY
jgi:M-phase inducer tyrosine phosphatase